MLGDLESERPPYSSGVQAKLTIHGPVTSTSEREESCPFWRSLGGLIPY